MQIFQSSGSKTGSVLNADLDGAFAASAMELSAVYLLLYQNWDPPKMDGLLRVMLKKGKDELMVFACQEIRHDFSL